MGIQEEECGECRTSDRLEQSVVKRKCVFKFGCRHGRGCNKWHSNEQNEHFDRRAAQSIVEWMAGCGFCEQGRCRYGAECKRQLRSTNGGQGNTEQGGAEQT